MLIKICGITNAEDALLCESLGADFLGFIFYSKSKRYISSEIAKEIIAKLSPEVKKVGVFVNEEFDEVNRIAGELNLDYVQLHGEETPEYCGMIHANKIKVFRIGDGFDFSVIEKYNNCIPLMDTYSSIEYGGTGKAFDWEIIPVEIKNRCFLSGGISVDNVLDAKHKVNPYAVDLSSSLELFPGKKDLTKVTKFFEIIKKSS